MLWMEGVVVVVVLVAAAAILPTQSCRKSKSIKRSMSCQRLQA